MHDGPISTPDEAAPTRKTKRRSTSAQETATASGNGLIEVIDVQRRAPFGDSPTVGPRGKGTQQRILRAALQMFGERGYRATRVEHITAAVGCSRPSFYQYFSSKKDLFRQLGTQVAREQFRITEAMGDVTPDADGWRALRAWLEASADLYEAYWPVYEAFSAAASDDDLMSTGAQRVAERQIRVFSRKVDESALRAIAPDELSALLSSSSSRANRYRQFVGRVDPDRVPDRARMLDCLTEVLHRTLFGKRGGGVIDHRPLDRELPRPPSIADPTRGASQTLGPAGRATYSRLLDAAATTFAAQGFHETRVDDIVEAAGTSHGTFYRYFANKEAVFRAVASRSARRTYRTIVAIADVVDADGTVPARQLRSWVDTYTQIWAEEGPIFRLWVESFGRDKELGAIIAQGLDVVRGTFARFLSTRSGGDADVDAFLLMSILDLGGPDGELGRDQQRDVLLKLIRRGFLGLDTRS
ncbi:MAG TPA: TetR/AcrR family transcriptional regulator [Acidimicrobiales bacterium]